MHIFFSVGEPSGDLHASKLIHELRGRVPGLKVTGFGGPLMREAGCELQYRLTDLAVMGILHVLPLLGRFIWLLIGAGKSFDRQRPDAVILVDFPGFNWWIARMAKRRGIPVFYYLPPQLWAWAPWRIRKVRKFIDHVLCGLDFEADWYRARGVSVKTVGHPFFDEAAERKLDRPFIEHQKAVAGKDALIIGILPGSRRQEIDLNFGVQLQVMSNLYRRFPNVRFLVASYKDSQRAIGEQKLAASGLSLPVTFHVGKTSEIIAMSRAVCMVSGSVSLECLARATPAVVLYRSGPFHYWLGRKLITCRFISLPNLIAGRAVMPEFVILGDSQREIFEITSTLERWIARPDAISQTIASLEEIKGRVAIPGATQQTASAILERMGLGQELQPAGPQRAAA